MTVERHNLWGIPLWIVDTGITKEFNNSLLAEIGGIRKKNTNGDFNLFDFDGVHIQEMRKAIEQAAEAEVERHIGGGYSVSIGRAWVNFQSTGPGESPHTHTHTPLVAVYYPKAPDGSGNLWLINQAPNAMNSPWWGVRGGRVGFKVQPKEGRIVMFPGTVPHYVEENKSSEQRVAIACNLIIKQKEDTHDKF